nr:MAG TPA: protein of unknown function (DUF1830) [Caudoviricetes sp.]
MSCYTRCDKINAYYRERLVFTTNKSLFLTGG